jgi:hypothetical protein
MMQTATASIKVRGPTSTGSAAAAARLTVTAEAAPPVANGPVKERGGHQ